MNNKHKELNETQEEIVEYLEQHEVSSLGQIAKELKLSYSRALMNIQSLKGYGIVDNTLDPPAYNLNVR